MNSSHFAHLSADFAELEEMGLNCLTLTAPTLMQQLVQGWRSLGTTSLQNLPRGVITGRT